MIRKMGSLVFTLMLAVLLLPTLTVHSRADAQETRKDAAYYDQEGMAHFNKGYYGAWPKGRRDEASQNFERAITAFKKAIAMDKNSVQAHRHLGRVYYVQERYLEAAATYRKAADLDPTDIETHVLTALAYTRIQRYEEAIKQLETAKTFTTDKAIVQKLDGYIEKIERVKKASP